MSTPTSKPPDPPMATSSRPPAPPASAVPPDLQAAVLEALDAFGASVSAAATTARGVKAKISSGQMRALRVGQYAQHFPRSPRK